jgi:two-component system, NtrC family, sensor histidine kinase AtoS
MPDQPKRSRPPGGRRQSQGEENQLFRHIVSSMRNGVLAVNRDGTLALMNDEAYRIFSMSVQPDDVGRPFTDVLRTRADVVRVLTAAFELNHLPNRAELRLKELDRVIGYTLSLVRDDAADTIGAVMFFKDLTRVEQLEERERLRDRLASLGEMAAGIAHELKNPLAGIEVMAGLLRRQVPDKVDAQSILADIISEAKLANAIVVEMLEFVRPIRLEIEPMAIADVLHQAVTLAESKTSRGGVSVTVAVPEGLPTIEADDHRLCQVFTNLIANAFEALDGKGAITITAALSAMEPDPAFAGTPQEPTPILMVDVADNGPGVPAGLSDRIFDPFFTTKTKGTGLGLGIVRKIVDAHDGRIDLSSSSETGTRFRVTLPVSSATALFK